MRFPDPWTPASHGTTLARLSRVIVSRCFGPVLANDTLSLRGCATMICFLSHSIRHSSNDDRSWYSTTWKKGGLDLGLVSGYEQDKTMCRKEHAHRTVTYMYRAMVALVLSDRVALMAREPRLQRPHHPAAATPRTYEFRIARHAREKKPRIKNENQVVRRHSRKKRWTKYERLTKTLRLLLRDERNETNALGFFFW